MAVITIKKNKFKAGDFATVSKSGFAKLVNSTQKKNTIILWMMLASNANNFNLNLGKTHLKGLFNVNDSVADGAARAYSELKELGFINDKDEFNEEGWECGKDGKDADKGADNSAPPQNFIEQFNF